MFLKTNKQYRPFDTPKLRAELLAAHQKCSNLHRDYGKWITFY